MEGLCGILGFGVFLAIALTTLITKPYFRERLNDRARALGLFPASGTVLGQMVDFSYAGVVDGIRVHIGRYADHDPDSNSTYWLVASAAIPGGSTLRVDGPAREGAGHGNRGTGDPRFDACLTVGAEPEALAVLDARARSALCELRGMESGHEDGLVSGGMVQVKTQEKLTEDNIEPWIRRVAEAARALARPNSLEWKLAENAAEDPEEEVARRNLEVLARRFSSSPTTLIALRRGLSSPRPSIRLVAALHLDAPESAPVLAALVAASKKVANDVRIEALQALMRRRPVAELHSVIAGALAEGPSSLRLAAVQAVGELGDTSHDEALQSLLHTDDLREGLALVSTLSCLGGRQREALLCEVLQRNPYPEVRRRAAEALAAQGTLASVAVLFPLSKALLPQGGVTAAAREAIRAIQARAEGGARGELQLSAQGAPAGALAAPLEAGALASAAMGGRRT